MITISTKKIKSFFQKTYDNMVENLPFHKLTCTCGRSGEMIRHGRYSRSIKSSTGIESIRILRVRCKSCGKTHALLPEWLVPYSSVLLKDHLEILKAYLAGKSVKPIMEVTPLIDESTVGYIVKQFKRHWQQRLAAFKIPIDENIVCACFQAFGRQFMQIKCTLNLLFS